MIYENIVSFHVQFNQLHTFSVSFAVSMSYHSPTSCSKDLIHKKSNYLNACLCDNSGLLFIFFLSTPFYVIEIDAINNQKSSISCYLIYLNCYWVDVSNLTTLIRYANESKPYREIYKYKCVLFSCTFCYIIGLFVSFHVIFFYYIHTYHQVYICQGTHIFFQFSFTFSITVQRDSLLYSICCFDKKIHCNQIIVT